MFHNQPEAKLPRAIYISGGLIGRGRFSSISSANM